MRAGVLFAVLCAGSAAVGEEPGKTPKSDLPAPVVVPQSAPVPETDSGESDRVIGRGELLVIHYGREGGSDPFVPALTGADVSSTKTVYVRVGDDGFTRFPPTDRNLPFAELELPVAAAMLKAHLSQHGLKSEAGVVSVERRRPTTSLVTVIGLVVKPGVYDLPADATLQDAIDAAGGVVPSPAPPQTAKGIAPKSGGSGPAVGSTLAAAEPVSVQHPEVMIKVEHPFLNLNGKGPEPRLVYEAEFAKTRLCVDGVILRVTPPQLEPTPANVIPARPGGGELWKGL